MIRHDHLCPYVDMASWVQCVDCDLIAAARADERRVLVEQLRAEFPKPTLGVQKAIRMVEGS